MKKQLTNKARAAIVIGTVGIMSLTAIANPILKDVKAKFKSTIGYTLDGEQVLEGKGGIIYNNQVYVPLRDVATTLGYEVNYADNTVAMKSQGEGFDKANENKNKHEEQAIPNEIIEKSTIKAVNLENNQVTILPEGKGDTIQNYVILNIDQAKTNIGHEKNKRRYHIQDLEIGMNVKVEHSPMMADSIPPQTPAVAITILEEKESMPELENVMLEDKVVVKVDKDNNRILIGDKKDKDNREKQYVINISEDTVIKDEKNKRLYTFDDMKAGQQVDIEVGPVMQPSSPPQLSAIQIIFTH